MFHHLIIEFCLLSSLNDSELFTRILQKNFLGEIVKIQSEDELLRLPLTKSLNGVKQRKTKANALQMEIISKLPVWLTDSVQLNLTTWTPYPHLNTSGYNPGYKQPSSIIAVFYRNLATFMPTHFLRRRQ